MTAVQHSGINPLGLMRILCGWNKLPKGMEDDCNALMDDPIARLSQGSIEFRSLGLRIYLIWLPAALLGAALLRIGVYDRAKHEGDLFIYWAGTFSLVATYLIGPLLVLSRRLRLDLHGFHIVQGRKELLVPWTEIIHSRDWDIGMFQIRIPVVDTAKDRILVTIDSAVRSLSDGASPFGFKFDNAAEINLTWPFDFDPRIFVEVAKYLAFATQSAQSNSQGGRAYSTRSSSVFRSHDEPLPGIKLSANGAIIVPVSALTFPPVCCRCGEQTSTTHSIHVPTRHYWWLPSRMWIELQIPVCDGCWTFSWTKYLIVIFGLEVFWTVLIAYGVSGAFFHPWEHLLGFALIALLPTRFTISCLSPLWWRAADAVLNLPTNEFRIRFANRDYQEYLIEHIRRRDEIG